MQIQQETILNFQLVGLNKTITITDSDSMKTLGQNLNRNETVNGRLFKIIENYLNNRYQVQAVRRKFVPIFLFKQGNFKEALKYPQRFKDQKRITKCEGANNTPYYFLVYLN